MDVKLLVTDGNGTFAETVWTKPEITDTEIEVKAIMTGVCRSDIDMMTGQFGPLPIHMSGHEGLGQVTKIGEYVTDVNVGDIVATRGEPAYADCYNVKRNEYVIVPEASPDYILEPVACGINVVEQNLQQIQLRQGEGSRLLIKGSGFLAYCAYTTLQQRNVDFDIDVVGSSNQHLWGDKLQTAPTGEYDIIIDLKGDTKTFTDPIYKENALIIVGSNMQVNMNLNNLLWKAVTVTFPSPRNPNFIKCMRLAEVWISEGVLEVDSFWTTSYNRHTDWQKAFEDGVNRPVGYSRGYIEW
mgnify:CR=1 FL=1|tara:strand:- start:981 stop:1874 length:894 start_codon:yes stop_codon:yes gene_type:complete